MLNSYTSVVILCGDQHVVEKGENNQEPKYFHCIYWDRAIQHKHKNGTGDAADTCNTCNFTHEYIYQTRRAGSISTN